jgi:hypothetical protein
MTMVNPNEDHRAVDPQKGISVPARGKSKLTNHHDLLPQVTDARSSAARRFRDLVKAYLNDAGGADICSEVKIGLCRRLAATTVLAELMEAKAINGEEVSLSEYCTLASTAVRISTRLGLSRTARDVTTLSDIIREDAQRREAEA